MRAWPLAAAALVAAPACDGDSACDEDRQAQILEHRRAIEIDGRTVEAEVADEAVERDRGWRHRVCDRQALLLLPDAPGPLPIWGCALAEPIDVVFVRDDAVQQVVRALEPCPEPCGDCPLVGEGLAVDAVVELPHDPHAPLQSVRLSP